jgi:hypothetical protein
MSATIEQPTTAPEQQPAPGAPQDGAPAPADTVEPVRLCAACASPLAAGQDWCLECGSAQPGRLGGRPGWRAALSVMGATGLLALGAGAAAYAALASDANREAAAPPPPAATPVVTAPPAQTAPAPPPADTSTPTIEAPKSDPVDVPEVKAPADPGPAITPPADTGSPGAGADTSGSSGDPAAGDDTAGAEPKPEALPLDAGAATTYDPYNRGGDLVGDPADAIDGKDRTAWEAPVDAEGDVAIGLAISLDRKHLIDAVQFAADTPGFTVEVYATDVKDIPPDILDARWTHIRNLSDVGVTEKVKIDEKPFRHVLLWITKQPADTKVAIPEVELLK